MLELRCDAATNMCLRVGKSAVNNADGTKLPALERQAAIAVRHCKDVKKCIKMGEL